MLREIAYREHAKNVFWPMKLEATLGTWHPNEKDVTTLGNSTSKLQISAIDILKEKGNARTIHTDNADKGAGEG